MKIELKKKYIVGTRYKNMKSPAGISGHTKKNKQKNKIPAAVNGKKVYLLDLSGAPKYCASSGRRLPTRGMVVEYSGRLYADYEASGRA